MLFRHSGIYILAKFIPGLMAFAALSFYTHLLSPDEYGVYTLIFTGTVLLHNVIFNWLPSGTLRYWSSNDFTVTEFTNTLSLSYLRLSLIMLVVATITIIFYWGRQEATWAINSFVFLIALALFTITQNVYSARVEPTKYAILTISYSLFALFFGVLFSYLGYGSSGVITGIALGTAIPALFVFKDLWLPYSKKSYNKELFHKLFIYGMPLAAAHLVEEIIKVSDRFMLASILGKAEAGLYAVGYDLSGSSIFMIMSALNIAAYPVIIKLLDTEGLKAANEYFKSYVILIMGVSIPAVIGLNLVGPNLVHLVIDEAYQNTVIFLLPWITSAIFLMGLKVFYFDLAFQLGQKTIASVKLAFVIAVVNIGLNYWLIPKMGVKGAAIATLSSFVVGCILTGYVGRKYFKLPFPVDDILKIVFSTFVMGLCLWWLKDLRGWGWLSLQLSIGVFSIFTMMLVFNTLDIRSHIKGVMQKDEP